MIIQISVIIFSVLWFCLYVVAHPLYFKINEQFYIFVNLINFVNCLFIIYDSFNNYFDPGSVHIPDFLYLIVYPGIFVPMGLIWMMCNVYKVHNYFRNKRDI